MKITSFLSCIFSVLMLFSTYAQDKPVNNQHIFDDLMYRQGSIYRTASGKPGTAYWQNRADYTMEVSLDENTHVLTGNIKITYTNNSPEQLDFIWLYLEQNVFTETSRGTLTTPLNGNRWDGNVDGGYTLTNIKANGKENPTHYINDTRMQVYFEKPIAAKGGKASVSMNFSYKIPEEGMDRMGRLSTSEGTIYALAQWYPRVAVFDDVVGWNTEPYLGAGEFYTEYGDYDYKITVPASHIVGGSGILKNPTAVYTQKQLNRLEKAKESDKTVYIIKPNEVGKKYNRPKNTGTITWHYQMKNTRDVAFASSASFILDAAKIDLGNGETGLAQSLYPAESDGDHAWTRSTEYTKASVEFYSKNYFTYPYKNAINVAANVGGMEYPGVSFCSYKSKGQSLWSVTDHEFGHNWFPMIVGSNERRYAWMDEGFNTFINHYSSKAFNKGEYSSYIDQPRQITNYLTYSKSEPINTYPDIAQTRNLAYVAYYKPAVGLIMLREYILEPERFDRAFKSYIKTWAYKHPQPSDFFNHIENVTGENLNWFWRTWFYGNGNIDIAVNKISKVEQGFIIEIDNRGEIPMPVKLEITYTDGTKAEVKLPVEIWHRTNRWRYLHKTNKTIDKVVFDAKKQVADINAANDIGVF